MKSETTKVKRPLNNKTIKVNNEKFKAVLDKLKIDEFFTKSNKRQKKFNKFLNGVVPEASWNYMADLIELPTTDKGYKWLLTVTDLATGKFDMEPLKNKQALTTLVGFKAIVKRGILKLPEVSLKTDGGNEFKAVFNQYLEEHHIAHLTALPYRHKQQAPIEGLNNTITRLLMNYLNGKSMELDEDYMNWDDILPLVRIELNKFRERSMDKLKEYQAQHYFDPGDEKTKYEIGNMVHYKLDQITDMRGKVLNDQRRRNGDRLYSIDSRKIVDVLYYPDKPFYRYKLNDMPNVTYSEYDLKLSKKKENEFLVKKIIGKKVVKKVVYYLVWWRGYLKEDSTWEPRDQLIEDGLSNYIEKFEKEKK